MFSFDLSGQFFVWAEKRRPAFLAGEGARAEVLGILRFNFEIGIEEGAV